MNFFRDNYYISPRDCATVYGSRSRQKIRAVSNIETLDCMPTVSMMTGAKLTPGVYYMYAFWPGRGGARNPTNHILEHWSKAGITTTLKARTSFLGMFSDFKYVSVVFREHKIKQTLQIFTHHQVYHDSEGRAGRGWYRDRI